MRLTALIIFIACMHVSAATKAQSITLSAKNESLVKVFEEIRRQAGYEFFCNVFALGKANPVNINVKNVPVEEVLRQIFQDQPLTWSILNGKTIVVKEKEAPPVPDEATDVNVNRDIHGHVSDSAGNPLAGASVVVKSLKKGVETNASGDFIIPNLPEGTVLVISYTGYDSKEVKTNGNKLVRVTLFPANNQLNQLIIIPYGQTTKRLNTGSISTVTSEDIEKQPVSNPLEALEGRVPGLLITQATGLNGAGLAIQIRGQNSIKQGSDPLFIIDGVPYAPGNTPLNQELSALGDGSSDNYGLSPFNLINPSDIESIEVLKDADATAIYGSRGANGVILITTKKGKAGKTKFDLSAYSGESRVTRTIKMMNTPQYLQMRREAFQNDSIVPDQNSAPDLFLWDTTSNTDFKKMFIGGTAHTSDVQFSVSGGSNNTQFLIGGGYHHQSTVFPTSLGDGRASVHMNLSHASTDKRFTLSLSENYSYDINQLMSNDLTQFVNTPPNIKLRDSTGKLVYDNGGVSFLSTLGVESNPLAFTNTRYTAQFQNLITDLQMGYRIFPELTLKLNLGYNLVYGTETSLDPSSSIDPGFGQLPYSEFANTLLKDWIIEPQAEYNKAIGKGKLNILLGGTWHEKTSTQTDISAYDYSSDALLSSIAGAGSIYATNNYSQYNYEAVFGRINYAWQQKYIVNLTGRRDGSSRFGPDRQFSNFGSASAAWIFSSEEFWQGLTQKIGFGKLRVSYGLTGNDQIGDYRYLDSWKASSTTYQGISSLAPSALYNPSYSWETNKKFDVGLDLQFWQDRLSLTVDYFNNRCSNQLIGYSLPIQTGFTSILSNLNAVVQNTGLELQVNSRNIVRSNFTWSTSFNLSIPRNKLISFPNLASSSYASTLVIGQPLSVRRTYHSLGVDRNTGIYMFEDVNKDGKFDRNDEIVNKTTNPRWYGGVQNNFTYKQFQLSFFFDFRIQQGLNYLTSIANQPPGYGYTNQPVVVLNRWQKPGDHTNIPKYTSSVTQGLLNTEEYLGGSDAVFSDASFLRVRNISFSYTVPGRWLKGLPGASGRIYIQAQNLFTLTSYVGSDPENQSFFTLPPLKVLTAGLQFNF